MVPIVAVPVISESPVFHSIVPVVGNFPVVIPPSVDLPLPVIYFFSDTGDAVLPVVVPPSSPMLVHEVSLASPGLLSNNVTSIVPAVQAFSAEVASRIDPLAILMKFTANRPTRLVSNWV